VRAAATRCSWRKLYPVPQRSYQTAAGGRDVDTFLPNARFFDKLRIDGHLLHTAVRYGLSQALLDATALASGRLKAEVVCDEWQLPCIPEAIPLFGQSGDDRYIAVDKMILKGVDVLPHALINNRREAGSEREKLREYVRWLSDRILSLRTSPAIARCISTYTAPSA
jgi:methylaspartate ammonia-lyase